MQLNTDSGSGRKLSSITAPRFYGSEEEKCKYKFLKKDGGLIGKYALDENLTQQR